MEKLINKQLPTKKPLSKFDKGFLFML